MAFFEFRLNRRNISCQLKKVHLNKFNIYIHTCNMYVLVSKLLIAKNYDSIVGEE